MVRGVNFQPVSITGRIDQDARKKMRITIPDVIKLIEEQTGGQIPASEWFTVPSMMPLGRGLGFMQNTPQLELCTHFACGMSTFIYIDDDGSYRPITDLMDIDKFIDLFVDISNLYADKKKGASKRARVKLATGIRYVKDKGMLSRLTKAFLKTGDYLTLSDFMNHVIMIGMMHFQDVWNFDLERVQHCDINYAVPDGRIIPFCTMNTIHRSRVEKKFSVPVDEWRARHKPSKIEEDSITEFYADE